MEDSRESILVAMPGVEGSGFCAGAFPHNSNIEIRATAQTPAERTLLPGRSATVLGYSDIVPFP